MHNKRTVVAIGAGLAMALALAACSSSGDTGSSSSTAAGGTDATAASGASSPAASSGAAAGGAAASGAETTGAGSSATPAAGSTAGSAAGSSAPAGQTGAGQTITVWAMDGDYTSETLAAINAEFTKQTGAKADVQIQSWDGITTKITTALTTSTPPDILDIGNTQVASFAANGGLKDLTDMQAELTQGQTWLKGLSEPATVDGRLYAVPGFAGARAVIYNKTMWDKAGVTAVPKTADELTAALTKVKQANTAADFSAFYLPGQNWYAGMQFIWDAGGEIAVNDGGKWVSDVSSPKSLAGLEAFKKFQNTFSSAGSRTVDTDTPNQAQVFADGKAGAILATNGTIDLILKGNPALKESDLATFPLPGAAGPQPVMLGGSDWGIAAKSAHQDLAVQWVKIATSPEIQKTWVFGHDGWIPNTVEATTAAGASVPAIKKGFFEAALNSRATPASPQWAGIEGAKTVNALFSAVASGSKTPQEAAKAYDDAANAVLNAAG